MVYSEQKIKYPVLIVQQSFPLVAVYPNERWRFKLMNGVTENRSFDGAKIVDSTGKMMTVKKPILLGKASIFWRLILTERPSKFDFLLEEETKYLNLYQIKSMIYEKMNSHKKEWERYFILGEIAELIEDETDLTRLYNLLA